ncbi:TPA: PIN domain-containing protein [Candidatus Micrarchaeota archaeon]|nr:PIN domain-containing protein [Candidatus Micrarchaeota archaeon]
MLIVDSSVWIEILKDSEKGQKAVEIIGGDPVFTAAISLAEISHWCFRYSQKTDEFLSLIILRTNDILQSNRVTEKRAGQLRFELNQNIANNEKQVGLVDCLIMALAEESGLAILTTDKHFLKFSGRTVLL